MGAEADREVLDAVDVGGPVLADRREDGGVGDIDGGLAHPTTQA